MEPAVAAEPLAIVPDVELVAVDPVVPVVLVLVAERSMLSILALVSVKLPSAPRCRQPVTVISRASFDVVVAGVWLVPLCAPTDAPSMGIDLEGAREGLRNASR